MKKSILLAFFACFSACLARAEMVTPTMAMAAADVWAARNAQFEVGDTATNVITERDPENWDVVLWHQVSMAGGGCLIIAPVTEIEPVVMALERDPGELPAAHPLRAILRGDIRKRLRFLKLYPEDAPSGGGRRRLAAGASGAQPADEEDENVAVVREEWAAQQQSKWDRLRAPRKGGKVRLGVGVKEGVANDDDMPVKVIVKGFEQGGPLTHWSQSGGVYNLYTPGNSVCGCVATAMSAMMQFFRVAETEGTKIDANQPNSACTYNGGPVPGGATTRGGVYDWSKFDSCTSRADYDHLSQEQKQILGTVAYDAGVAVGMQWTKSASGAMESDIATAFTKYFKFHEVRYVDNPTQDQYAKLIYAQCRANAPVGLGIEMHSVVAVGYGIDGDGVERVRVFMGWGGTGDGWYALPYIDTKSTESGSNYLSEIVDGVITLIGYQDDKVVPVCGRLLPYMNADMTIGGTDTQADANGLFGLRVSAKDTQNKQVEVVCNSGSKTKVGSVSVGSDPGKDSSNTSSGAGICRWVPDPILLPLLNSEVALGFVDAREKSIASITNGLGKPKPVLAFSGNWSELPTIAAWDYLSGLDEGNVDDFTNKFVVLCTPFSLDNLSESDGNPSIGVFDGRAISSAPNKIWSFYNGRLAYWAIGGSIYTNVENQVDNDIHEFYVTNNVDGASFIVTNSMEELLAQDTDIIDAFEYNGNVPARYITGWGITNAVENVFDVGLDNFLTRVADISVTITNLNVYAPVPPPAMTPALDYGTYMVSNGVEYVSSVPEFVTNAEQNVEYKCWGNIFFATNSTDGSFYAETNENVTVQKFVTVKDYAYKVTWFWEISKVKITTETIDDGWNPGVGAIEPGTGWFPVNTRVTFKAVPPDGASGENWYFENWMTGQENNLGDGDMYSEFGNELTVFVERPVTVRAMFKCGQDDAFPDWGSFKLTVTNACLRAVDAPSAYSFSNPELLNEQMGALLDGSSLTNGGIAAATAPKTLLDGTVFEYDTPTEIEMLGIKPFKLAAGSATGSDGQEYICCGWRVSRHVSVLNNRTDKWEDQEEVIDFEYTFKDGENDYACTIDASGKIDWNYALESTVSGVRAGDPLYAFQGKPKVQDGDELTLTWIWTTGRGDDTSNVFDIEWEDAGSGNLRINNPTNLLTIAEMASKGWTTSDLVVTAPRGWIPDVRESGGNVIAELQLDFAALSNAMETCALTVSPNDGGTYTVKATIAGGLRGFWYVLYGSDDLITWEAVTSGTYESGTPAAQAQGTAEHPVAEVNLSIVVTPGDTAAGVKRFYKVVSGATTTPLTTY